MSDDPKAMPWESANPATGEALKQQQIVAPEPGAVFLPTGSRVALVQTSKHASIIIIGRGGVGKSHLVNQLARDAEFGPQEILVIMAEDSVSTYDAPVNVRKVRNLGDVQRTIEELKAATLKKLRLPRVIVWDSLSGTMDYQRRHYDTNPILSELNNRDKRAEFGDMGYGAMNALMDLRDWVGTNGTQPCDCVTFVTSYEPPGETRPELGVEGKLIPRNLTRLSSVCLYMRAEETKYDPKEKDPKPAKHRTIGLDETGAPTGKLINRYFYTQDAGEVTAKGHHSLLLRERAILPDVLRKLHTAPKDFQPTPPNAATTTTEGEKK